MVCVSRAGGAEEEGWGYSLPVGMGRIVRNPGLREVEFLGQTALKRDFMAFSLLSC